MRKYTLVDKATGEEIEADADTVERETGVEIGYIDWCIGQDGKFENRDWEVCLSPMFGDPLVKNRASDGASVPRGSRSEK